MRTINHHFVNAVLTCKTALIATESYYGKLTTEPGVIHKQLLLVEAAKIYFYLKEKYGP